jgi:hypothetical protein
LRNEFQTGFVFIMRLFSACRCFAEGRKGSREPFHINFDPPGFGNYQEGAEALLLMDGERILPKYM